MKIILIISFLFITLISCSQVEHMTVGMRLGGSTGVSFNYFEGYRGFEGLLTNRNKGIQVTGIYKVQKFLDNRYRLNFWIYYGGGLHVGYVKWKKRYGYVSNTFHHGYDWEWKYNPVVGADGSFGVEYRFLTVPLCIGLDYKPYFELFGKQIFRINLFDFGFTVKYLIK